MGTVEKHSTKLKNGRIENMTTYTRSSFKGGSAGAIMPRVVSEKVAGMLPLISEINHKAKLDLGLRNDKLKKLKGFETKRKLL